MEEIGREFNMVRFSSVSSVAVRMKGKKDRNRQLRKRIEEKKTSIYLNSSKVNGNGKISMI